MIRFIFSASMIVIGSFLEIFYYVYRFKNDGIAIWLSIIIGVGLTLLLTMAVHQRREKWARWIIVPVAAYSIFATSAGQAFSLNEILNVDTHEEIQSEYALDEIADIELQIERIDAEMMRISNEIDETTNTLADRGMWRTTLSAAEERQDELQDRRDTLSDRLRDLRLSAREHGETKIRATNIYQFYGQMLGWSEEWLQFGLQTILSIFIALMAPIGIMTLPSIQVFHRIKKEESTRTETERIDVNRSQIEKWVHINWIGIRNGRTDKMIPKNAYSKFIENRKEIFDEPLYNEILFLAKSAGVVADDGTIKYAGEKPAVDAILAERMKK